MMPWALFDELMRQSQGRGVQEEDLFYKGSPWTRIERGKYPQVDPNRPFPGQIPGEEKLFHKGSPWTRVMERKVPQVSNEPYRDNPFTTMGKQPKGPYTKGSTLASELLKVIDERMRAAMPGGGGGSDTMGGMGNMPGRPTRR